jgi:hypothetical protein
MKSRITKFYQCIICKSDIEQDTEHESIQDIPIEDTEHESIQDIPIEDTEHESIQDIPIEDTEHESIQDIPIEDTEHESILNIGIGEFEPLFESTQNLTIFGSFHMPTGIEKQSMVDPEQNTEYNSSHMPKFQIVQRDKERKG